MVYVTALLVLAVLVYVAINVVRYPWHALVFLGAALALGLAAGAGSRLWTRLDASPHPAARRFVAACRSAGAIARGAPPYNEARWWIVRTLVQVVYWALLLALALAVVVALGGIFVWLDRVTGSG